MSAARFKAENYGEVLAVIKDLELVSYEAEDAYQGEYMAVLTDGKRLFYFFDSFGSCSGCDWLEDERDWTTEDVDFKAATEYCADIQPKYIVPKNMPLKFKSSGTYEGWKLVK